jgi:hypothetical protein
MEFFNISVSTIVMRFFLMMGVIITGVFTGQYWLVVLGLPIFLSAMLGVGFKSKAKDAKDAKRSTMQSRAEAA